MPRYLHSLPAEDEARNWDIPICLCAVCVPVSQCPAMAGSWPETPLQQAEPSVETSPGPLGSGAVNDHSRRFQCPEKAPTADYNGRADWLA